MGYSVEMKEAVLKKALMGDRPHHEIAKEAGIGRSTLGHWLRAHRRKGNQDLNSSEKRPQNWTAEEKFNALIATAGMAENEKAAWCRRNGLFGHHLEQWKKDMLSLIREQSINGNSSKSKVLKKEVSKLQKELLRKEKALAETAALLVLKKKADSIWGEREED